MKKLKKKLCRYTKKKEDLGSDNYPKKKQNKNILCGIIKF